MATATRRRALVAAAVAGAALLGTVTGLVVAKSSTEPATVLPAAGPAAVESSCGLQGTPGPAAAGATSASWTTVAGGWQLPTSTTDGPGRQTAGPWSCFTRTESGAVLAAYVISMRAGGLADDWQAVVREQTMPGPGQNALLAAVPNTPTVTVPRGFSLAAYSPEAATVRYRLQNDGADYTCDMDVRWFEGDWRLVVGDDGSTARGCVRGVPESFTPWGA